MKNLLHIILFFFLINCSFDNKSGIWKNENSYSKKDKNLENLETLFSVDDIYDKTIPLKENYVFSISKPIKITKWTDNYYGNNNNYKNFQFTNNNSLVFKSKKFTKYKPDNFIKFFNDYIITSDQKGNIISYSLSEKKIVSKFNFYKKNYKKIKKKLNSILEKNIIYVADNIGYLYAYDYTQNTIIWAKNYKIPFGSNLKIFQNSLVAVNQNNNLFFFNKNNGELIKSIPTEESLVKNNFINNLSLNNKSLLFLNTYGSLYSIDINNFNINWFINLNLSLDLNPSKLFLQSNCLGR